MRAAWLNFPHQRLELLDQVYERTAERQYHYESNGGSFTARLTTDGVGFVTDYSGLWRLEE